MRYFILSILCLSFAFGGDSKPLPPEAQTAVDQMELQISKARQECLVKLNKVIMDITKTGNLEAALVVKNKETEIIGQMPKVELFVSPVVGKWRNPNNNILDVKEDGKIGTNGKWELRGNKFIMLWDNGGVDTYIMPIKNNMLTGSNKAGATFTIIRIPDAK